ncbi:MAG: acylphosphatase [Methanosarcinales archaeon]|nr:acylphosphatase [Methanosarcinales archaeon]
MKLKVIIKGKKIHDVGYRVLLVNKALSFGLDNFNVFNIFIDDVQAVIAVIEGNDEILEEFKAFIHTTGPKDADVESINIEEYKNAVPPIERCMQAFQMEQCGKVIPILLKMLDKQDSMLGKQDSMIELQNETIVTIKAEGEKTDHVKSILSKVVDKVGISE